LKTTYENGLIGLLSPGFLLGDDREDGEGDDDQQHGLIKILQYFNLVLQIHKKKF